MATTLRTTPKPAAMTFSRTEASVQLQAIIDNVFDAIITIDDRGIMESFNPAAERIFGYTADEAVGRNVTLLMHEPHAGEKDGYIRNYLETGKAKIIGIGREVTGRRKDGTEFPLALAFTEMRHGKRKKFVGILRDMTQRKQMEAERSALMDFLRAANQDLETFSYSVSHDLRAPLRAMDGFSHALIEEYGDKLDDTARDYLGRIRCASQRMGQLIEDILSLSRISRRKLNRKVVDLSAVAEEIGAGLRDAGPERDVEYRVQPGMVADADEGLVRVVLENLLGNAWKFTEGKDGVRIEIGAEDENGTWTFFVRDNGAGFDMAYADKLFQPFQRLHSDVEYEGTGIGLATVARAISRHGGRIWSESEIGRGTTMHFTLEKP